MPSAAHDDKSPLILIATILLLVVLVFSFALKTIVKVLRKAQFAAKDDVLLGFALVFGCVQSIAQCLRAAEGFGRPFSQLSRSEVSRALQLELIASIFYILSITLAKVSTALMLATISPDRSYRHTAQALCVLMAAQAAASVLVLGFQCHLPHTWDYTEGACVDRVTFWTAFDALNGAAEFMLIVLPIYLIRSVQLSAAVKRRFSIPFGARLLTIAALVADAVVWNTAIRGSSPQHTFFEEWQTCVTMQLAQASCFFSACAVFMGRFFGVMQTGWGLDVTIKTVGPIELMVTRTIESTRSKERLREGAAPFDGVSHFLPPTAKAEMA